MTPIHDTKIDFKTRNIRFKVLARHLFYQNRIKDEFNCKIGSHKVNKIKEL